LVPNVPMRDLQLLTKNVKRFGNPVICVACVWALVFGGRTMFAQDSAPAKALLQWVGDARKAGLSEQQIEVSAAAAGWQESAVRDALHATADLANSMPAARGTVNGNTGLGSVAVSAALASDALTGHAASGSKVEAYFEAPPSATVSPLPAPGDRKFVKPVQRGAPDDYQIGAGDGLRIVVWHEPDATVPSVVVRPDGRISMPLLKEVDVFGLTPSQLEARITEQLKTYLTAPDVTVIVTAINSKKIYVAGAVKKEGPIPYTYRMTVLQALSEAGGLNDYAKRTKIYVLRNQNGREFRLPFDYDGALKGERMELNVLLMAGDTIVVPH
jgi:polysaccharide biosynthesis/export protein